MHHEIWWSRSKKKNNMEISVQYSSKCTQLLSAVDVFAAEWGVVIWITLCELWPRGFVAVSGRWTKSCSELNPNTTRYEHEIIDLRAADAQVTEPPWQSTTHILNHINSGAHIMFHQRRVLYSEEMSSHANLGNKTFVFLELLLLVRSLERLKLKGPLQEIQKYILTSKQHFRS